MAGIVGCVTVVCSDHIHSAHPSATHFIIDFTFTSFFSKARRAHDTQFPSDFHFVSRGNPIEFELEKHFYAMRFCSEENVIIELCVRMHNIVDKWYFKDQSSAPPQSIVAVDDWCICAWNIPILIFRFRSLKRFKYRSIMCWYIFEVAMKATNWWKKSFCVWFDNIFSIYDNMQSVNSGPWSRWTIHRMASVVYSMAMIKCFFFFIIAEPLPVRSITFQWCCSLERVNI